MSSIAIVRLLLLALAAQGGGTETGRETYFPGGFAADEVVLLLHAVREDREANPAGTNELGFKYDTGPAASKSGNPLSSTAAYREGWGGIVLGTRALAAPDALLDTLRLDYDARAESLIVSVGSAVWTEPAPFWLIGPLVEVAAGERGHWTGMVSAQISDGGSRRTSEPAGVPGPVLLKDVRRGSDLLLGDAAARSLMERYGQHPELPLGELSAAEARYAREHAGEGVRWLALHGELVDTLLGVYFVLADLYLVSPRMPAFVERVHARIAAESSFDVRPLPRLEVEPGPAFDELLAACDGFGFVVSDFHTEPRLELDATGAPAWRSGSPGLERFDARAALVSRDAPVPLGGLYRSDPQVFGAVILTARYLPLLRAARAHDAGWEAFRERVLAHYDGWRKGVDCAVPRAWNERKATSYLERVEREARTPQAEAPTPR